MIFIILTIPATILFLLSIKQEYPYVIEDRSIITYKFFKRLKYKIHIDNILKVYTTSYPDEVLLSNRRRGFNTNIDKYIQIEFKLNYDWKSTVVTPDDSELFIKQIELLQKDSAIMSFLCVDKKTVYLKLAKLILLIYAVALILDLSSKLFHLSDVLELYHLGYLFLIPLATPILEYILLRTLFKKWIKNLYKDYHENLDKYAIRYQHI